MLVWVPLFTSLCLLLLCLLPFGCWLAVTSPGWLVSPPCGFVSSLISSLLGVHSEVTSISPCWNLNFPQTFECIRLYLGVFSCISAFFSSRNTPLYLGFEIQRVFGLRDTVKYGQILLNAHQILIAQITKRYQIRQNRLKTPVCKLRTESANYIRIYCPLNGAHFSPPLACHKPRLNSCLVNFSMLF